MRTIFVIGAALALAACVSTQMKQFIGSDITEAQMRYGAPANVIALPDGRRAYQFEQGGGVGIVPSRTTSVVQPVGTAAVVSSSSTPAILVEQNPCLLTFIARQNGAGWTIEDIRVPRELVC